MPSPSFGFAEARNNYSLLAVLGKLLRLVIIYNLEAGSLALYCVSENFGQIN